MKLLLIGAPGAGKGVQGDFLLTRLGVVRISTGDMLREQQALDTPLGREIKSHMGAGALVPDELIIKMLQERLTHRDCAQGYILDGFPRTVAQAEALTQSEILPDYVVILDVPSEIIIQRICGRLTHLASGRVYHEVFNPPLNPGCDDMTGEPLVRRDDDNELAVSRRLEVFASQTAPVIEYYKSLDSVPILSVDGDRAPELVHQEIMGLIEG